MANWFSGGFEQAREIKEQQERGDFEFANTDKCRFWVSPGKERNIIFLDDFNWKVDVEGREHLVVPCCRHEYKIDLNTHSESWKNCVYITCTQGMSPCKPAEVGFKRSYVGAMTVLDITPFQDKETGNTVIRPRKRLMMATATAMSIIETKKNKKGNLRGWKYSVGRHERTDPRVGSDFEPEEQIQDVPSYLKALNCPEIDLAPYGMDAKAAFDFYMKLFEPMPYEDQEKLFSNNVRDGGLFKAAGSGQTAASGGAVNAAVNSGETISY